MKLLKKLTELCKVDSKTKNFCKKNKETIAKTILNSSNFNTDRITNYSHVLKTLLEKPEYKKCNFSFLQNKGENDIYKVEKILGVGGQGCVYLAFDTSIKKYVIIKSGRDLKNEKRILKKLSCKPQFFPCYIRSFIDTDYKEYIVTKPFFTSDDSKIPADDLSAFIKNKDLKDIQKKEIFLKILKAVKALEKLGIKHKDLKPENILINNKLEIQIIDFGVACYKSDVECSFGHTRKYQPPGYLQNPKAKFENINELYSLVIILGDILNEEIDDIHLKGESFEEKLKILKETGTLNLKTLYILLKSYCISQNCTYFFTIDSIIELLNLI